MARTRCQVDIRILESATRNSTNKGTLMSLKFYRDVVKRSSSAVSRGNTGSNTTNRHIGSAQ